MTELEVTGPSGEPDEPARNDVALHAISATSAATASQRIARVIPRSVRPMECGAVPWGPRPMPTRRSIFVMSVAPTGSRESLWLIRKCCRMIPARGRRCLIAKFERREDCGPLGPAQTFMSPDALDCVMAGSFESMYEGTPPWDIGRPQPEFIRLEGAKEIRGRVLDVGCGTGENALYLAERGHEVWGIDSAPTAFRKSKSKGKEGGTTATFRVHDALELHGLGRTFDTAIDSGLFHTFADEDRPLFAASLASVLPRRGRYLMMCVNHPEAGTYV